MHWTFLGFKLMRIAERLTCRIAGPRALAPQLICLIYNWYVPLRTFQETYKNYWSLKFEVFSMSANVMLRCSWRIFSVFLFSRPKRNRRTWWTITMTYSLLIFSHACVGGWGKCSVFRDTITSAANAVLRWSIEAWMWVLHTHSQILISTDR
jgi:hypothetical protein